MAELNQYVDNQAVIVSDELNDALVYATRSFFDGFNRAQAEQEAAQAQADSRHRRDVVNRNALNLAELMRVAEAAEQLAATNPENQDSAKNARERANAEASRQIERRSDAEMADLKAAAAERTAAAARAAITIRAEIDRLTGREKLDAILPLLGLRDCIVTDAGEIKPLSDESRRAIDSILTKYAESNPNEPRTMFLSPARVDAIYAWVGQEFAANHFVINKMTAFANTPEARVAKLKYALFLCGIRNYTTLHSCADGTTYALVGNLSVKRTLDRIAPGRVHRQAIPVNHGNDSQQLHDVIYQPLAQVLTNDVKARMYRTVSALYGAQDPRVVAMNGLTGGALPADTKCSEALRLLGIAPIGGGFTDASVTMLTTMLNEYAPDLVTVRYNHSPDYWLPHQQAGAVAYKWIVSLSALEEIKEYKRALSEGDLEAGVRLKTAMGPYNNAETLTVEEFISCLINTKLINGHPIRDWAATGTSPGHLQEQRLFSAREIDLLSQIGFSASVVGNDAAHAEHHVMGMAPLLLNHQGGISLDRENVVENINGQSQINQGSYKRSLQQRLLPLLIEANNRSTPQNKAIISLPIGAGPESGHTPAERSAAAQAMNLAVIAILTEHAALLPNIAGVFFDSLDVPAAPTAGNGNQIIEDTIRYVWSASRVVGDPAADRSMLAPANAYRLPDDMGTVAERQAAHDEFDTATVFRIMDMGAIAAPANRFSNTEIVQGTNIARVLGEQFTVRSNNKQLVHASLEAAPESDESNAGPLPLSGANEVLLSDWCADRLVREAATRAADTQAWNEYRAFLRTVRARYPTAAGPTDNNLLLEFCPLLFAVVGRYLSPLPADRRYMGFNPVTWRAEAQQRAQDLAAEELENALTPEQRADAWREYTAYQRVAEQNGMPREPGGAAFVANALYTERKHATYFVPRATFAPNHAPVYVFSPVAWGNPVNVAARDAQARAWTEAARVREERARQEALERAERERIEREARERQEQAALKTAWAEYKDYVRLIPNVCPEQIEQRPDFASEFPQNVSSSRTYYTYQPYTIGNGYKFDRQAWNLDKNNRAFKEWQQYQNAENALGRTYISTFSKSGNTESGRFFSNFLYNEHNHRYTFNADLWLASDERKQLYAKLKQGNKDEVVAEGVQQIPEWSGR
ncbi:MAG: hypothetical protein V4490_00365, partial [Pseudomonadota bacterium]